MDPNATLETIRSLITEMNNSNDTLFIGLDIAPELADAISHLDEFLSRGGFLPDDWADEG